MNLQAMLRQTLDAEKRRPSAPQTRSDNCWRKQTIRPLSEFLGAFDLPRSGVALMETSDLPDPLDPTRILYLDAETTGLSGGAGTVAFQIGLGRLTPEGFVITQLLMRDYPEEVFLLEEVARALASCDAVCTFNGRTFDIPLLHDRMVMKRIDPSCLEKPHIDLLHIARRVYKLRLRQCNLGRLEEMLLGVRRESDLPGAQVPERYFSYLKTGHFDLLDDVLAHNEQDIASLCILLTHLAGVYREPEQLRFGEDLYAMGHGLERHRHHEEARRCWEMVDEGRLHAESQLRLAASWRRAGERGKAAAIWQSLAQSGEGGLTPWVELAKYYEHTERDYPRARDCVRRAIALLADPATSFWMDARAVQEAKNTLQYRYARLERKLRGADPAGGAKGESDQWD